jgi:hypothetical protein
MAGRDGRAIARAAERSVELVDELRAAQVAQGDLQHGFIPASPMRLPETHERSEQAHRRYESPC